VPKTLELLTGASPAVTENIDPDQAVKVDRATLLLLTKLNDAFKIPKLHGRVTLEIDFVSGSMMQVRASLNESHKV